MSRGVSIFPCGCLVCLCLLPRAALLDSLILTCLRVCVSRVYIVFGICLADIHSVVVALRIMSIAIGIDSDSFPFAMVWEEFASFPRGWAFAFPPFGRLSTANA